MGGCAEGHEYVTVLVHAAQVRAPSLDRTGQAGAGWLTSRQVLRVKPWDSHG